MRRNLACVVACVLTVAGVSGCGGGPSDRDIQAAVSRYYSAIHDFDLGFPTRNPVGIRRGYQSKTTDVQVKKRGEPFTPNVMQSMSKPMTATSDGYPVRVFVKGTIRRSGSDWLLGPPGGWGSAPPSSPRGENSEESFEGEADFILWYVPPDKSKVDPEPGTWVAHPR